MSEQNDIAIKVDNVSKSFKLPHEKVSSIKGAVVNFSKKKKGYEKQVALKDISFDIKKGEFFGIVGRNGSGKSTILKLISGIYTPDKGSIQVKGKLTPFIELGVGFNPELSGRDNVFLNGALLGFSRREMEGMYDEIVEFAEIRRFMDQKLKNYSSGMQVRLAFSIAIRANTDILVLDEVLAVGDAAFQQKCTDYFYELKKKGTTVILVTHDMGNVEKFCTRALIIEDGKTKSIGRPKNIANQYTLDNLNAENKMSETNATNNSKKELDSLVTSIDIKPKSPLMLSSDNEFSFDVIYEIKEDIEIDIGVAIVYQNISLIEQNTRDVKLSHKPNIKHIVSYKFSLDNFNPGRYGIHAAIFKKKGFKLIGFDIDSCSFIIDNNGKKKGGVLAQRGEWKVK